MWRRGRGCGGILGLGRMDGGAEGRLRGEGVGVVVLVLRGRQPRLQHLETWMRYFLSSSIYRLTSLC